MMRSAAICGSVVMTALWAMPARAIDCAVTTVGLTPVSDLGTGLYLGLYEGGLYPGGANTPPAAHHQEGLLRAQTIQPLDGTGVPAANGKTVFISVGMSNTTQEFCSQNSLEPCDAWTFMGQAAVHPDVAGDPLVIVNGARGGQAAQAWQLPTAQNYQRIINDHLTPKGLTEAQVQVAWVKLANPQPQAALPAADADAFDLATRLADVMRTLKIRYPNLQIVLLSNRIYAGYATSTLNPEPQAYESALAIKFLIGAQIAQMTSGTVDPLTGDLDYTTGTAPWLAWGPDLWADGLTARSDGLVWECADLDNDGTHPAQAGEQKVGTLLLDFMLNSPYTTPWFSATGGPAVPAASTAGLLGFAALLAVGGAVIVRRRIRSNKPREGLS